MSQPAPVKTEGDPTTTATPAPTTTPAPAYPTAQWGTAQLSNIDPALQQHPQHPTTSYYQYQHTHYPQAGYGLGHYQPYIPQQTAQPQTPTPAQRQPAAPAAAASSQLDTADVATLNDALGSAGVDLRAEEETLQRTSDQHQAYRQYDDRSRKQPATPNFDTRFLGPTMRTIGTKHKVTKIPDDAVNYVALALRARLQELVTAMIAASVHRTDTQFDRTPSLYADGTPMWGVVVRADVAKQLAALERAEKEEEIRVRRERKELAAQQAATLATHVPGAAGAAGGGDAVEDGEGPKKKKKKVDGPGVTAKNMSEDVRKKMSNAVASQAAGLGTGKYAWMNASNAATPAKPKPTATPAPAAAPATTTAPAPATGAAAGTWSKPYVSATAKAQGPGAAQEDDSKRVVTLRDALFVVEKERGHGGGRGAARGWV